VLSIIQAAGWPIWPLIACSVIGVALVIERFLSLQTHKIAPPHLVDEAILVSQRGLPKTEVIEQLQHHCVLGEVLASGFVALAKSPHISEEDLRASLQNAGRQAAAQLQRYLGALATIASAAPLIGLLGTVIGMIEIFASQAGGGLSVGSANPAQLAQGIAIALYNTAFGLIVAIPALMFWRYFRARVDSYLLEMEIAADQFARHLVTLRR
jgi:biopolymer transport protein ExbB